MTDDGVGIGDATPGNGLSSLRERADELAGRVRFDSDMNGTRVQAEIPLDRFRADATESAVHA